MSDDLRRFKAGIFQALAHPSRIAIVELLRDEGQVPVGTIHERLGLEQANVSQHLAVLRSKQIVVGRKDGNQVFYSLRDRVIGRVLDSTDNNYTVVFFACARAYVIAVVIIHFVLPRRRTEMVAEPSGATVS